jgi:hypothetical protein
VDCGGFEGGKAMSGWNNLGNLSELEKKTKAREKAQLIQDLSIGLIDAISQLNYIVGIVEKGSRIHADDSDQVPNLILRYVKELEAEKPKWIPVSKRFPEDMQKVLLWFPHLRDPVIGYKNTFGEWRAIDAVGDHIFPPTHWRPLPQPPEESHE